MTDRRRTDVLIVGGGVVGLACAHAILEAGRSVRIIEKGRVGSGASQGNCGLITPSHAVPLTVPGMVGRAARWMLDPRAPFYVRPTLEPSMLGWLLAFARNCNRSKMLHAMQARGALLKSSRQLYDALIQDHRLDCEWETRGVLAVYKTERAMDAGRAIESSLREIGVASREVRAEQLLELEPALREGLCGGHLYESDAHLRPERFLGGMHRLVLERGACIEEDCPVHAFRVGANGVEFVQTERGEFAADEYVLALGAWTPKLAKILGLDLPIQPGKGYTITMPRPALCPTLPCILAESAIGVTPWSDGLRLGGTMEFSGYDSSLNHKRIAAILRAAGGYLQETGGHARAEYWSGWRPMTPDELPFIGRSPVQRNVTLAVGHGMMGVSMAPATGKLVSEILTGAQPHIDPTPYRVDRP